MSMLTAERLEINSPCLRIIQRFLLGLNSMLGTFSLIQLRTSSPPTSSSSTLRFFSSPRTIVSSTPSTVRLFCPATGAKGAEVDDIVVVVNVVAARGALAEGGRGGTVVFIPLATPVATLTSMSPALNVFFDVLSFSVKCATLQSGFPTSPKGGHSSLGKGLCLACVQGSSALAGS